jgi:hypothetical protein
MVLPCSVEKLILIPFMVEPDRVDNTVTWFAERVLPDMVENPMTPALRLDVIKVDVITVLP